MISQRTAVAVLAAVIVPAGVWAWTLEQHGPCDAYEAGQAGAPTNAVVEMGGRSVVVPCDEWFWRQPDWVKGMALVELAVVVVAVVYAVQDWLGWKERRRRW